MNAIVEGKIGSVEVKFEATGCAECVQDTIAAFHEWRKEFEAGLSDKKKQAAGRTKAPCGNCPEKAQGEETGSTAG